MIEAQFTATRKPKIGFHCTIRYDESTDAVFEKQWEKEVHDKKVNILSQYIMIGKEEQPCRWYTMS